MRERVDGIDETNETHDTNGMDETKHGLPVSSADLLIDGTNGIIHGLPVSSASLRINGRNGTKIFYSIEVFLYEKRMGWTGK